MENRNTAIPLPLPEHFTITTPRCRLRIAHESDIPQVFSASRHPGFNDGILWDAPATIEELREPHRRSVDAWKQGTAYGFTVEEIGSGEFLGRISIRKTDEPAVWSIGFWTHPDKQGKGYASEVTPAVIALGFEKLGAKRIEACHAQWNAGSRRILEKAGMRFVRHVPEGFQKGGKWVAEDLLAIEI